MKLKIHKKWIRDEKEGCVFVKDLRAVLKGAAPVLHPLSKDLVKELLAELKEVKG